MAGISGSRPMPRKMSGIAMIVIDAVQRREQHGEGRVGQRDPLVAVGAVDVTAGETLQANCAVHLSMCTTLAPREDRDGHGRCSPTTCARRWAGSSAGCAREPGPPLGSTRSSAGSTATARRASATSRPRATCAPSRWRRPSRTSRRRGLVQRRADPDDGRRSFVEVTAAGRGVLEETRAHARGLAHPCARHASSTSASASSCARRCGCWRGSPTPEPLSAPGRDPGRWPCPPGSSSRDARRRATG